MASPPKGDPIEPAMLSGALTQMVTEPGPIAGRKIGVLVDDTADLAAVAKVRAAAVALGATVFTIAPHGGTISSKAGAECVDRLLTTRSIEFDSILVADGVVPTGDLKLVVLLQEAFRHCKSLGAWGTGSAILEAAGIDLSGPGILTAPSVENAFNAELAVALGLHRSWARAEAIMASQLPPSG